MNKKQLNQIIESKVNKILKEDKYRQDTEIDIEEALMDNGYDIGTFEIAKDDGDLSDSEYNRLDKVHTMFNKALTNWLNAADRSNKKLDSLRK